MTRVTVRRFFVLGVCSAFVVFACGAEDGKTQAPPATGGSAGALGNGGAGGDTDGELRCGTASCAPVMTPAFVLPACCPDGVENRCGLDVSAAAAAYGLSAGCIEVDQPGSDDATCPAASASAADSGGEFAGCCRAGTCGVRVDLTSALGVDFGCVDPSALRDASAPEACGAGGSGGQGGQGGQGGLSGSGGAGGEGGEASVEPMCSAANPCTWQEVLPVDSPPVLAWAAMAYDAARDNIVLFGGAPTINGGALTNQTWIWDGDNWEQVFPTDDPGARWTHGMVYDEARQVVVLFGGLSSDQPGSGLDDTWEWDGSNWNEVITVDAPDPRGVHGAMAYDSLREKVVVRGGGTFPGQEIFGDTWEYDGMNWVEVAGAGPDPLVAPAIAYDKARGHVLYFGGGTWGPYQDRTFTFDGSIWDELMPADKPEPRQSARLVYDATRSLLLLFGGDDGGPLNDMWEWNGENWAEVLVAGPPPRCCYAYAHDPVRRATVLFGGSDNQTWVYSQ